MLTNVLIWMVSHLVTGCPDLPRDGGSCYHPHSSYRTLGGRLSKILIPCQRNEDSLFKHHQSKSQRTDQKEKSEVGGGAGAAVTASSGQHSGWPSGTPGFQELRQRWAQDPEEGTDELSRRYLTLESLLFRHRVLCGTGWPQNSRCSQG